MGGYDVFKVAINSISLLVKLKSNTSLFSWMREARTDFVRKSESVDARGCQNLLRAVSGKFNIF
jgi:hypothetical protein